MGLSFERSSRLHGEVNDRSYLTVSIDGEVFGEIREDDCSLVVEYMWRKATIAHCEAFAIHMFFLCTSN